MLPKSRTIDNGRGRETGELGKRGTAGIGKSKEQIFHISIVISHLPFPESIASQEMDAIRSAMANEK